MKTTRWAALLAGGLFCLCLTPGVAQAADPAEETADWQFKGTRLREAIATIFHGTTQQFLVLADVPDVPVDLTLRSGTRLQALRLVIRQAAAKVPGLRSVKRDDVHIILMGPPAAQPIVSAPRLGLPPAEDPNGRRVTIRLQGTPVRDAIRLAFQNTGLQYSIDPAVPNVPVELALRDITLGQAMRFIVQAAAPAAPGLTILYSQDVYVFKMVGIDRRVTVDFRAIPLKEALRRLFEATGYQYRLDPALDDLPVDLGLQDVTLALAVGRILSAASPDIDYFFDGYRYVIQSRPIPRD